MDELGTVLELVKALGGAGTLFLLFFLWQSGLIKIPGLKNGDGAQKKMDQLASYYNHDLTEKMEDILDKQQAQCKKLDKIEGHLEEIRINGVRIKTN